MFVPPGIKNGTVLRVKGEGNQNYSVHGDLIIEVDVPDYKNIN